MMSQAPTTIRRNRELATKRKKKGAAEGEAKILTEIRPDLNIEKWSIWQPSKSKNPPSVRVFDRKVTLRDGSKVTAQVEVGFTDKGTITTEDQKTYYALVEYWEKESRSPDLTLFSLRELARFLQKKWGTNVIASLTQSLTRLRVTPIIWRNSYYDCVTGDRIKILTPFTILSSLKIVERENDGVVNQARGFFRFDEHILSSLTNNHSKPLRLDVVLSFKGEIAQILYTYLDLIMADKTHYERRTHGLFSDLGLKGKRYVYPSIRRQILQPVVEELKGVPLSTGVLTTAIIEETSDGKDYKVVFRKSRQRRKPAKIEPLPPDSEPSLSELAQELHNRGVSQPIAIELAQNHPEDHIREKIKMFDFLKSSHSPLVSKNPPGWLRQAILEDWKASDEQLEASATREREQNAEDRKERWLKRRQELIEQGIRDWDKTPPEKRIRGMFALWCQVNHVDPDSEEGNIKKQEYIDGLPTTEAERREHLYHKEVSTKPPDDFK